MISKISAVLALLLALAACRGREASPADVRGTWTITSDSQASLTLQPDGTFQAVALPGDMLYIQPPAMNARVSGSGKWTLAGERGAQQVRLAFLVMTAGGEGRVPYETRLSVDAGEPPTLYYFRGDPDEGNRIELARR